MEGDEPHIGQKKRFWTYIKHQRSSNVGIAPLKVNGRLVSDPKEQAGVLNHQFQSTFSKGKAYSPEEFILKCNMPHQNFQILDNVDISSKGVAKLLSNLHPAKRLDRIISVPEC